MGAVAGFIGGSVHAAIFPRFSQLVAANEKEALRQSFFTQAQLLGAIVAAIAVVIMMYAQELIHFWTKDAALASQIAPMTRVLAFGAALNAMMMVPYAVILAHGRSHYAFITNSIAVVFIVPLVYFLADAHGALGASFAWPILNLTYVLVQAPIVLGILLPGSWWPWFKSGVLLPLIVSASAVVPIRVLYPSTLPVFSGFVVAIFALMVALISTASVSPEYRRLIRIFTLSILSGLKLSGK
jgi:O-antigen/teichoic acid export membrane protein